MKTIDLNCDLGEGFGNEEAILPFISSANIACGYHAGDENTIWHTVELCIKNNVAIGAHPSFLDKINFGRNTRALGLEGCSNKCEEDNIVVVFPGSRSCHPRAPFALPLNCASLQSSRCGVCHGPALHICILGLAAGPDTR